ncbi:MAG: hypothetical protein JW741_28080, partial [Sedimentisphaerales bacterium]|nr:hypothetical protein [Sedimentisphaerales bacterium]
IGYHYARPGVTDDHLALMPSDLRLVPLPDGWQPVAKKGSANSVFFAAEDLLADDDATQIRRGRLWAGGKLLAWSPKKSGDRKDFTIPVDSAGKKQIYVTMAMTPQSGTVAFRLDGEPLPLANRVETVDLYRPYRTLLRNVPLMTQELKAGDHTLTVEWRDTSNRAGKPEVGIDFIWVQRR